MVFQVKLIFFNNIVDSQKMNTHKLFVHLETFLFTIFSIRNSVFKLFIGVKNDFEND